jgi:hypothetical protein
MKAHYCKINKCQPTSAQRKVLQGEVLKEFNTLLENFNHDVMIQMLYLFHFKRGYGQKRLKQLNKDIAEALDGLNARYELSVNDTAWLCEKKLREDGIDVDELFKEG